MHICLLSENCFWPLYKFTQLFPIISRPSVWLYLATHSSRVCVYLSLHWGRQKYPSVWLQSWLLSPWRAKRTTSQSWVFLTRQTGQGKGPGERGRQGLERGCENGDSRHPGVFLPEISIMLNILDMSVPFENLKLHSQLFLQEKTRGNMNAKLHRHFRWFWT